MNKFKVLIVLCLFLSNSLKAQDGLKLKSKVNLHQSSLPIEDIQQEELGPSIENYTYDSLSKIRNDKEVVISSFSKSEKTRILNKFSNKEEVAKIQKIFIDNLYSFLNVDDAHCETRYISNLFRDLKRLNGNLAEEEMLDIFKMLRVNNSIDDVYYEILESLSRDYYSHESVVLKAAAVKGPFTNYEKKAKAYDLEQLFSNFKTFPDETSSCSYSEFIRLRENVGGLKDKVTSKNKELKKLAYLALDKKLISLETYNELKFLADNSTLNRRNVWLNNYFRITFLAKNKMIPFKRNYKVINLEDESKFSSERIKRFSSITRRKILFKKYDESQIILLTQVMKKASQRMGVDPDTKTSVPYLIHQFYIEKESGQTQNLVEKIELDTQDQFNLARKLLRKDMVALQMMKSFQNVDITYTDLVMASLETGYISLDDIEYVVKYDDLWNPETSKTDRMINMTFRIAGYGTFFLPPPWNVTAALALSVIEGIVDSKNINGASNDNPNSIIE